MKKIIYSLVIILIFLFIPKVKASELIFGTNGGINIKNGSTYYVRIEDNINNLPFTTGIAGSGTLNTGTLSMWVSPASAGINVLSGMNYNYLIFDTCSTAGFTINISNNGCNGSCAMSGSYSSITTSSSCTVGSYTGTRRLVQVPIQKWYLNEVAEEYEVDSFITFTNGASWYNALKIQQVFLSDEDYTITYANQNELVSKLDSVATAITNMQNSINSNANTNTQNIINNNNTNTQNIINNQNQNAQQQHNDAVNTQNTIKDDTVDSNTGKSFFDGFSDNTHGLSGIITAPLNIIQQLVNVNPTQCSDLSTTYHGKTISMKCGSIFWGHTGFSEFNTFYNLVVGGAFCYLIIKDLFLTIEKLKDPDNDKVEVMDL